MGFVYAEVEVSNPAAPEIGVDITLLVATEATFSVLPASLLDRLGIHREGARVFHASGGLLTRDTGIVRLTYKGVAAGVSAVFGAEDDPVVMGETALGVLGYQVDSVHHRLVRADMLL